MWNVLESPKGEFNPQRKRKVKVKDHQRIVKEKFLSQSETEWNLFVVLGLVCASDVPQMSNNESHCITLTDLNNQMEITKCNLIAHITSMCVRTSQCNIFKSGSNLELLFVPLLRALFTHQHQSPKHCSKLKNLKKENAIMQVKWSKKAWRIKLKIDETLPLSNSSEAFSLIKILLADVQKTPQTRALKVCQDIRPHIQMTEQQMHGKR